jgi:hypothetical protein
MGRVTREKDASGGDVSGGGAGAVRSSGGAEAEASSSPRPAGAPSGPPRQPGAPGGALRYQEDPPSVGAAYVGFVLAIVLGAGAEAIIIWAFLTPRPITPGDFLGFVFFQWAPLLLWLMVGLGALARTRPWWGREIRGSVYRDHRSFFSDGRHDLATVKDAWISAGTNDQGAHYRLTFTPAGESRRPSVHLPVHADSPQACTGKDKELLAALADALAENPAQEGVAQAVADLRFLAGASGRDAYLWLSRRRS